jgi:hypothetical protein
VIRARKSIVLAKLAEDASGELGSMMNELASPRLLSDDADARRAPWSGRFAASGKSTLIQPENHRAGGASSNWGQRFVASGKSAAPRIRLS